MFRISARTILELGSELISSDTIAFYELIKNALDARSKTGAEVGFQIVLRRNQYLKLRGDVITAQANSHHHKLAALIGDAVVAIEPTADADVANRSELALKSASSLTELLARLDEIYQACNFITVADTGNGMSKEDLEQDFMTIGTASRKRHVDHAVASGASRAPYLGEKGIGRLSAMRLGRTLCVETAKVSDAAMNILEVDWNEFDNLDALVEDISFAPRFGDAKPSPNWSGTVIKIGGLSEDWSLDRAESLAKNGFARIVDPFEDPKSRARIAVTWNGRRVSIPAMNPLLIENAHASINGEYLVQEAGATLRLTITVRNLGFEHAKWHESVTLQQVDLYGLIAGAVRGVPEAALSSVGSFRFEVHWYNRRVLAGIETIGNQRAVRDLQRAWSGILLFRDGFRVFPYGEDADDWLGLDRRALGRRGYGLNKAQFVGRVQIGRTSNPGLVDQTNREGLRVSAEQTVFVSVLQYAVSEVLWEHFRQVERENKVGRPEVGDLSGSISSLESRAAASVARLRHITGAAHSTIVEEIEQTILEFRNLLDRAKSRVAEVEAEARQMVDMAGVGLMLEVVAHELARSTESALLSIEKLRRQVNHPEVTAQLSVLHADMKAVSKRLRILDELSVAGRQRAETFDLCQLLRDLRDAHAVQLGRHGVRLQLNLPRGACVVRVVKGLVIQILENLLSNSLYWIKVRKSLNPTLDSEIRVNVDVGDMCIRFSDNGVGVSPEHVERIFLPFFSLKEKSKRRGLGLYIARENASFIGGSLHLDATPTDETGRLNQFVLGLPESAFVR